MIIALRNHIYIYKDTNNNNIIKNNNSNNKSYNYSNDSSIHRRRSGTIDFVSYQT